MKTFLKVGMASEISNKYINKYVNCSKKKRIKGTN